MSLCKDKKNVKINFFFIKNKQNKGLYVNLEGERITFSDSLEVYYICCGPGLILMPFAILCNLNIFCFTASVSLKVDEAACFINFILNNDSYKIFGFVNPYHTTTLLPNFHPVSL